jgi:hypothetical protein
MLKDVSHAAKGQLHCAELGFSAGKATLERLQDV